MRGRRGLVAALAERALGSGRLVTEHGGDEFHCASAGLAL
jgi:hypothetical protein